MGKRITGMWYGKSGGGFVTAPQNGVNKNKAKHMTQSSSALINMACADDAKGRHIMPYGAV